MIVVVTVVAGTVFVEIEVEVRVPVMVARVVVKVEVIVEINSVSTVDVMVEVKVVVEVGVMVLEVDISVIVENAVRVAVTVTVVGGRLVLTTLPHATLLVALLSAATAAGLLITLCAGLSGYRKWRMCKGSRTYVTVDVPEETVTVKLVVREVCRGGGVDTIVVVTVVNDVEVLVEVVVTRVETVATPDDMTAVVPVETVAGNVVVVN